MTVFLVENHGRWALIRRPDKGLLAGLWEFPNIDRRLNRKQTVEYLSSWIRPAGPPQSLSPATHIFTHLEWHMTGYAAYVKEERTANGLTWVTKEQLSKEIALPSAFRAYTEELFRRLP